MAEHIQKPCKTLRNHFWRSILKHSSNSLSRQILYKVLIPAMKEWYINCIGRVYVIYIIRSRSELPRISWIAKVTCRSTTSTTSFLYDIYSQLCKLLPHLRLFSQSSRREFTVPHFFSKMLRISHALHELLKSLWIKSYLGQGMYHPFFSFPLGSCCILACISKVCCTNWEIPKFSQNTFFSDSILTKT